MFPDERIVFIDLETGGLMDVVAGVVKIRKPVIQIAAVAVDSRLAECGRFETKISFDESDADAFALRKNGYDRDTWRRESVSPLVAAKRLIRFLRQHATVDRVSSSGRIFQVAKLAAHNAERFDGPILFAWYEHLAKKHPKDHLFFPASFSVLCTKQKAYWLFEDDKSLTPPEDFRLETLCRYFGVPFDERQAHEALYDVLATVDLYRAMIKHQSAKVSHVAA